VRLEKKIEQGIAAFYTSFHISRERAEQIREAVREELASKQDEAARSLQHALKRKNEYRANARSSSKPTTPASSPKTSWPAR
jgi:vacuolar-type H+-ATPase subunit E/Vma4